MEMFGRLGHLRQERVRGVGMQVLAFWRPKSRACEEAKEPAKRRTKGGLCYSGRIERAKLKSWKPKQEISERELPTASNIKPRSIFGEVVAFR